MWKRAKAKQALMDIMPNILSKDSVFLCKEEDGKLYIRHVYEWKTFSTEDKDKYIEVLDTEELSVDLVTYLNDILKKYKKGK